MIKALKRLFEVSFPEARVYRVFLAYNLTRSKKNESFLQTKDQWDICEENLDRTRVALAMNNVRSMMANRFRSDKIRDNDQIE